MQFFRGTRFISAAVSPRYCLALDSFLPFPALCRLPLSGQNGIYVVADKTYWIPDEGAVADVLPYGAVPGTAFSLPNSSEVGWLDPEGIVIAGTQGNVKPLTGSITHPARLGVSTVFDGEYTRVVSCGWCVNLEKRRGYPVRGLGSSRLCLGITGQGRDGLYATNGGGSVYASVGFGDLAFGDGQLNGSECPPLPSHPPTRCGHACSGRGTPTTTTRDRARNHSGLSGWMLAVASLYLV